MLKEKNETTPTAEGMQGARQSVDGKAPVARVFLMASLRYILAKLADLPWP